MLDDAFRPGSARLRWEGEKMLEPGGTPVEFVLP
jgi:hypothetical protein